MAKPHCLVVSYPLQGTLIPTVHLALRLAEKGFTVTFVNTESIDRRISTAHPEQYSSPNDDIFAGARMMGLDIRYELVGDGLPLEFDRPLNHDQFMAALLHVFSAHVDHLLSRIMMSTARKEDPPITCLIADTFFVWPATLARKYGLLYVSFWTEPAVVFSLYYHLPLLRLHGHFGSIDKREEEPIDCIPGVASMQSSDLMSYLQATNISTVNHQIIFKAFDQVKLADYVLCNTVYELEPEVVAALGAEKPFYTIGPISRLPPCPVPLPATTMWSESDCSRWLAGKPHGTVLYVSFGSFAHLSYSDLHEIAMGSLIITTCNTNNISFLWALRPDTVLRGRKEEFYEEYCKDDQGRRHRVVQWCDQSSVLSNPAIGGFLTHCGWNSVMESLWCGVPMLCLPLLTDQLTNRKLVVDDWKVGVTIGKAGAVRREAVAKAVEEVMTGKQGEEMRTKVKNLQRVLHGAVSHGGSSAQSLDRFVHDLETRINKKDKNSSF